MGSTEDRARRDREIRGVVEEVDNHAGPRSLIVLAVVSEEIVAEVKNRCDTG